MIYPFWGNLFVATKRLPQNGIAVKANQTFSGTLAKPGLWMTVTCQGLDIHVDPDRLGSICCLFPGAWVFCYLIYAVYHGTWNFLGIVSSINRYILTVFPQISKGHSFKLPTSHSVQTIFYQLSKATSSLSVPTPAKCIEPADSSKTWPLQAEDKLQSRMWSRQTPGNGFSSLRTLKMSSLRLPKNTKIHWNLIQLKLRWSELFHPEA